MDKQFESVHNYTEGTICVYVCVYKLTPVEIDPPLHPPLQVFYCHASPPERDKAKDRYYMTAQAHIRGSLHLKVELSEYPGLHTALSWCPCLLFITIF